METYVKKIRKPQDARKVFRKKGTCSQTFFYLFDRHFEHVKQTEERASDSLAGGIMQRGHQCGMLWGAALAIGSEAYRRFGNMDNATKLTIRATQRVMASFSQKEATINCREVTHCDFSSKWSFTKYFLSGRFLHCFALAQQWAPDAIEAAESGWDAVGTSSNESEISWKNSVNCASLVVQKLGATKEEMVMVAGFAGGLGLSGGGCGALSAAIWMRSLSWCRKHAGKNSFKNLEATRTLEAFDKVSKGRILCSELCGQSFETIADHNKFMRQGGCAHIIQALSESDSTS